MISRISSFLVYLLFTPFVLWSQVNLEMGVQSLFGGSGEEGLHKIIKSSDGGYLVIGYSYSGISGNKTTINYGQADGWVFKLNAFLEKQWEVNLGGSGDESISSLEEDAAGNIYVAVTSGSGISGNKTVSGQFWLVKLSSSGHILWQKAYGEARPLFIGNAPGNALLIATTSSEDITGYKSEPCRGASDYWLLKIDSAGNKIWDKTLGSSGYDNVSMACALPNGDMVVSGISSGNASGEKTHDVYGVEDAWVVKVSASGNVLWDITLGGSGFESQRCFILGEGNRTFVALSSQSDLSGNKTEPSKGGSDCWLIELDQNGNIARQKVIGGSGNESPGPIFKDSFGELVIPMSSSSNISGDKTEDSKGLSDFWVVALNDQWEIVWQKTLGGPNTDGSTQMVEVIPGQYVLAGGTFAGTPGDILTPSYGGRDLWFTELKTNLSVKEIHPVPTFHIYPNPSTGRITLEKQAGADGMTYQAEIIDVGGQKLQSLAMTHNQHILDFSMYPSGMYWIRVTHGENVGIYKIVLKTGE